MMMEVEDQVIDAEVVSEDMIDVGVAELDSLMSEPNTVIHNQTIIDDPLADNTASITLDREAEMERNKKLYMDWLMAQIKAKRRKAQATKVKRPSAKQIKRKRKTIKEAKRKNRK